MKSYNEGNKAKGRILKRVLQVNKARQIYQKTIIREIWCALFSCNTRFWDFPIYLFGDELSSTCLTSETHHKLLCDALPLSKNWALTVVQFRGLFKTVKDGLFFYQGSLSRTFTIHRTAGEGGGYLFNSSLPLPPISDTLRH